MDWLSWALVATASAVTGFSCRRLERRVDTLRRAVSKTELLAAGGPTESLLCFNDWVDEAERLRDLGRLWPRALGRVCLMSGVGLAIFQAAHALGGGGRPHAMAHAGLSLVGGLTGLGLAFFFAGRLRVKNQQIFEKLRLLRATLQAPARTRGWQRPDR